MRFKHERDGARKVSFESGQPLKGGSRNKVSTHPSFGFGTRLLSSYFKQLCREEPQEAFDNVSAYFEDLLHQNSVDESRPRNTANVLEQHTSYHCNRYSNNDDHEFGSSMSRSYRNSHADQGLHALGVNAAFKVLIEYCDKGVSERVSETHRNNLTEIIVSAMISSAISEKSVIQLLESVRVLHGPAGQTMSGRMITKLENAVRGKLSTFQSYAHPAIPKEELQLVDAVALLRPVVKMAPTISEEQGELGGSGFSISTPSVLTIGKPFVVHVSIPKAHYGRFEEDFVGLYRVLRLRAPLPSSLTFTVSLQRDWQRV